jgi:fumarate reductase flavoprotein subunit
VPGDDRGFNVSWHDWLNLRSLVEVSQAITAAALAREDSRGAHFREDFPQAGELDASRYTVVRRQGDALSITTEPVRFTRVQPGQSLLQ